MIREILFDMDDTLFLTNLHYDKAILKALSLMSDYLGNKFPSLEKVFLLQKEIDHELHKNHGYGAMERFSNSLIKTYKEICKITNTQIDEGVSKNLFEIGKMPFDISCYKGQNLLHGVEETLDFLVQQKCSLKIYTKGIQSYQREKIEFFNLCRWFKNDDEHIIIVSKKTPDNLRSHISKLEEACFVTDSSEDVKIGIESGIKVAQVLPPKIYQDRWGNFDDTPESPLHYKFNSMIEFKANYHSI